MDERLTAILPCNDLDAAQSFFERLGFKLDEGSRDGYRMLSDGFGGHMHLNPAVTGWLQAGRNPFGLYLYREDVDGVLPLSMARSSANPVTSRGACTSLQLMGLTAHWCEWAGRPVFAQKLQRPVRIGFRHRPAMGTKSRG
jgi:hypothetical protein